MKAIVFGGSGFLGSHVADALTSNGYEVTLFDLKPSAYLLPGQKMTIGDIMDENAVFEALKGCDYIYNFAGIADLDDATTRSLDTVHQNIVGTTTILEAARKHGVKRFVYASTIYVYSDRGGFYRCSKQAAELYIEEYARKFGLDYTILRYGTAYGSRADSRNSVYRYLKQAVDGGKIVCGGTGDEIREYIHVKDIASLSVAILSDKYRNQHITITGHHPMRFRDMLSMIREMLNNRVEIEFSGTQEEDHYSMTPYSFIPKIGKKLVSDYYVDLGQGLLECLTEIHNSKSSG